jgi:flagellar biosynthetic protein FliO
MALFCVAVICSTIISVGPCLGQPKAETGTFDIEKVRAAVSNEQAALSPDSPKAASTGAVVKTTENLGIVILRIALYLAVTIGMIFLVIWGIKRIGFAGRSKIGGGSMDVLEALPLGQNRSVVLIRVVDKVYLLSQSAQQINVLETIEGQKALEIISSTKGVVSMAQFKEVFNNFVGRFKK